MITIFNVADLRDPNDPQGRTYRQVNAEMTHAIPLGALVELETGERLRVMRHARDCDQTPLYSLGMLDRNVGSMNWYHGYCDESLTVIPPNTAIKADLPPVLDACCGSRMFWFDKQDERALFVDNRRETWPIDIGTPGTKGRGPIVVDPDEIADFTALPYPDEAFAMVVFDPPHIERTEAKGLLTRKYGNLTGEWRDMLRDGFAECFRVLRPEGVLIFKWAESDHPVSEILKLTPEKPLFGHRSGKQSATHWIAFMKAPKGGSDERSA